MKLVEENVKNIDINDILYLKLACVGEARCVVAGLKGGRRIPLTTLETKKQSLRPIAELDKFYNGKLLKDFYVGDCHGFAIRRGAAESLILNRMSKEGLVQVGVKLKDRWFGGEVIDLAVQPTTDKLTIMTVIIENEFAKSLREQEVEK